MNQNNIPNDEQVQDLDGNNQQTNSNNSDQLNPHYYNNENYNPHGAYNPDFNAGTSSYKANPIHQPIQYDETGKQVVNSAQQIVPQSVDSEQEPSLVVEKTSAPATSSKEKKIINIKLFVIIGVAIVGVILVGFLIYKLFFNKHTYVYENFDDTEAFFLYKDDAYALFNEDGEQLTDFIFLTHGEFYGGSARVITLDDQDAIIKETGDYIVEPGETKIYGMYGLYELVDFEKDATKVVNYKGDTVASGSSLLNVDVYASGAIFAVLESESLISSKGTAQIFNYAGKEMGTLDNIEDYDFYSYDGSYATLIGKDKTVLYNIDTSKKILETDGSLCVNDGTDDTVLLDSRSTWGETDDEHLYVVVKDGKIAYTKDSDEISLYLAPDGSIFQREGYSEFYTLLDDKGNPKQENIIGYQDGKNYVVDQDERLMFYKDNVRENIIDCAAYYQNASDKYYIIKVDRYADECRDKIDNQYTYYDLAGNAKSDSFYSAGVFNENGRAIVSTDNLENYVMNDSFEILGDAHYQMTSVGNLYIVWDEKHNQALMDDEGKIIEKTVLDYRSYGTSADEKSYVIVETAENVFALYNSQNGEKIGTIKGENVIMYKHYLLVDDDYYSYKTGKKFFSKN